MFAGIIAIILLSAFVLAYSYTGCHVHDESGATDYKWEPNQFMSNMTEGFSWIRMDSNGYNNLTASNESPDILLIGSSHMEAVQVSENENTGYLLNECLDSLTTYNIGISGHNIYTCIKNISSSLNEFKPQKYVVIETNSVELDVAQMRSVLEGDYPIIPSYDSGLIYYLQKMVPATKTIYNCIDDWRNAGSGASESVEVSTDYSSSEYKSTLNEFILHASEACKSVGVKLIIFYHPMTEIDGSGNLIDSTDAEALNSFEETCRKNNVTFVNMHDDFFDMYEREHRLPYGFINTSVGKGHLNKYGHRVIAERLSKVITSMESSQEAE